MIDIEACRASYRQLFVHPAPHTPSPLYLKALRTFTKKTTTSGYWTDYVFS